MKATKTKQRLLLWLLSLGLLAFGLTLLLRRTNTFSQTIELPIYDTTTQLTWPWKTGHPNIVLVTIQNADNWPLDDKQLADVLGEISGAGPNVIAIDLIRDSYRSGDPLTASIDAEALDFAFAWDGTLLTIEGLTTSSYSGFDAPPYFQQGTPETLRDRVGLANFPRDEFLGFKVRRGLFKTSEPDRFSLPALAAIYASASIKPEDLPTFEDFDRISSFESRDGGYALPNEEIGSQFLLKFGPNLDTLFPEYSMAEVQSMTTEERRTCFSGKIVFLGTGNTQTAKDEIPVIGNQELRGIKLLALATAQLIREMTEDEEPIQTASPLAKISLIIIGTLLAIGLLFLFRLSGIKRFAGLFALLALLFATSCLALRSGIWMPVGAPMTSVFLTGVFGSLYLHREITVNLRTYSSTLKQQFGDQVASVIEDHREELLEHGTLPKRIFDGSALFCDLLGFTAITEKYARKEQPDEFLSWINNYLAAMVPLIREYRGVIVKFAGDGIFVVFGFPDEADHADCAVQCCRDMEAALTKLNQNLTDASPPYFVRAGIYSGPIFAGPVGSRERLSYDFLGGTINKAARLESLEKESYQPEKNPETPPLRTLISTSTKALLENTNNLKPFGDSPKSLDQRLQKEEEKEPVWELIF